MTLRSNTSYIENASDEDVERWLNYDDAKAAMMREGSRKLLEAIQDYRGELFICKHKKAGNTHRIGDKKMCKTCRAYRWRLGFERVKNKFASERIAQRKYEKRQTGGGYMWPRWYKPHEAFDVSDVIALVGASMSIKPTHITGKHRNGPVVDARRVVAKILRERGWSYPMIGRAIGGRDHSTIINLLKNWDYHWKRNPDIPRAVRRYCFEYRVSTDDLGGEDGQG